MGRLGISPIMKCTWPYANWYTTHHLMHLTSTFTLVNGVRVDVYKTSLNAYNTLYIEEFLRKHNLNDIQRIYA